MTSPWRGRYVLLVFDCLLVVGIYFSYDIPSALQTRIQTAQTTNCSARVLEGGLPGNTSCCDDCLGLGPHKYNQLYTISSWTSAAMILPVGFAIDRLGNRISALLFTGIASIGMLLFAVSSFPGVRGSSYMFPLMMLGRLCLGAGTGPSRIVRDRIISHWFRDKLSLVFGIAVSTMGIGSVLTFLLTSNMAEWIGLTETLLAGAGICSSCFVSAVCVCLLDWYGSKRDVKREEFTKTTLGSFRQFPLSFWLICLMLTSYYSFQLPFTANGSKFLHDKFGYSKTGSSAINGIVYDVSVVLSPIVGAVLQKIGRRGWSATVGALLTLPVAPLLLYTDVCPIVGNVWIGITFTITVVSLWSSLPQVVPVESVGTANGIASCMLDLTVGLTSLAVGEIVGATEESENLTTVDTWKFVFLLLFGHATICTVSGFVLNCAVKQQGRAVNMPLQRQLSIGPVYSTSCVEKEVARPAVFTFSDADLAILNNNHQKDPETGHSLPLDKVPAGYLGDIGEKPIDKRPGKEAELTGVSGIELSAIRALNGHAVQGEKTSQSQDNSIIER